MSGCGPVGKRLRPLETELSLSSSLHTGWTEGTDKPNLKSNSCSHQPDSSFELKKNRQIPMRHFKGKRTKRAHNSLDHWLVKRPNVTQTNSQSEVNPRDPGVKCPESPSASEPEPVSVSKSSQDALTRRQIQTHSIPDFFTRTSFNAKTPASGLAGKTVSSDAICRGVPLSELKRTPACSSPLPSLKSTDTHTVMIRTDLLHVRTVPLPFPSPEEMSDCWDASHVKMPFSKHNLFPDHSVSLQNRWALIKKVLTTPLKSSDDVKDAILKYNATQARGWDFTALHLYCKGLQKSEAEQMFGELIPAMVQLALRASTLCTQPIPLLKAQKCHSITLSQEQVSCLLANAFFCTFPRRSSRRTEFSNYPDINFNRLFEGSSQKKQEKLKTVLWYFKRVLQQRPTGVVTYTRRCLQTFPLWWSSKKLFSKLHITYEGTIEEQGYGLLQVDFANRFVGGGVTSSGLVQEEIRFLINPDLIAARLFTEALDDNECLIITGTEQFSKYSGYSDTYRWNGNHDDQTPRDEWQRRYTEIVAMDALHYRNVLQQFHPDNMRRELNKAYCGFARPEVQTKNLSAVATGNWGCGAFGGDARLKAVLQMVAAAEAQRDLIYFTFGDAELLRDIHNIHTLITHKHTTVGTVFCTLEKYYECVCKTASSTRPLENLLCFLSKHL